MDIVLAPTREQLLSLLQHLTRIGVFVQDDQALLALQKGTMFNAIHWTAAQRRASA